MFTNRRDEAQPVTKSLGRVLDPAELAKVAGSEITVTSGTTFGTSAPSPNGVEESHPSIEAEHTTEITVD